MNKEPNRSDADGRCSRCGAVRLAEDKTCSRCLLAEAGALGRETRLGRAFLDDLPMAPGELMIANRYTVLATVGRGGMGVVYKARQEDLQRVVALKMLLGGVHATEAGKRRFLQEAKSVAQLSHPNIVSIYDWGEDSGQPFLSMEYVEGRNLAELAREFPLSPTSAAEMVRTLARAIQCAHDRGIIHRDLKPANVLVDAAGTPRVTDFGLARQIDEDGMLTASGDFLGTPGYLPPEQISSRRGEIGPRSDIYGLGAILYYLVTCHPPQVARSIGDALQAVQETDPIPPRRLNASIPRDLETICLKCLEKAPDHRYATADAVATDLGRWLNGEPIQARPVRLLERGWKWARRRPTIAGLATALVLVACSAFVGMSWLWRRAASHASAESRQRALVEEAGRTTQRANQDLREANGRLHWQAAEEFLRKGDASSALVHAAQALRSNPADPVATARVLSILSEREFHLPSTPPLRHDSYVRSVDFSPDGTLLATTSEDKTARLWDTISGRPIGAPLRHGAAVTLGKFSPDGLWLATGSWDGAARLWEVRTGLEICPRLQHKKEVTALAFSRDGRRLISASSDGVAQLWSVPTGERIGPPLEHWRQWIRWVEFSGDGRWLATAAGTNVVVWKLETGERLVGPFRHEQIVYCASFSPDAAFVLTAGRDRMVRRWSLRGEHELAYTVPHSNSVGLVRLSPDGGRFLSACDDGRVRLWHSSDGTPTGAWFNHSDVATSARWHPRGISIATASDDWTARLWSVHSGLPIGEPMRHDQRVGDVAFNAAGSQIATASFDSTARLWTVQAGRALPARVRFHAIALGAQWSPHDGPLLTAFRDGKVRAWDADGRRLRDPSASGSTARSFARFSQDGVRVVFADDDGTWEIQESPSGRSISGPISGTGRVKDAGFSPDGSRVAVATSRGMVFLRDARDGRALGAPIRHGAELMSARFSPDGAMLVTAAFDGTARLWDVTDGHSLLPPLKHGVGTQLDTVRSAEFSPDGRRIVTASENGGVTVWSVDDGRRLLGPLKHQGFVSHAEFSSDGRKIVSASFDQTARLWDAETGRELTPPLVHGGIVSFAHFSPDGSRVVTGSRDHTARIWDAATGLAVSEPLRHRADVREARFSPDGRRLFTLADEVIVRLWECPAPPMPAPPWLAGLAEAIAGSRLNQAGVRETVEFSQLEVIRTNELGVGVNDFYTRWGRWFFADPAQRTVSAFTSYGVQDYVADLSEENSELSLREAMLLAPNNALVLARLSNHLARHSGEMAMSRLSEAAFLSREALRLAPQDVEVFRLCQGVLERAAQR